MFVEFIILKKTQRSMQMGPAIVNMNSNTFLKCGYDRASGCPVNYFLEFFPRTCVRIRMYQSLAYTINTEVNLFSMIKISSEVALTLIISVILKLPTHSSLTVSREHL